MAGELSGDSHAAALVGSIRKAAPETHFFGATGPRMRASGVESVVRTDQLSILGLLEIGSALPKFLRAYQELKQAAVYRKPAAVILVDWPDFNLRLARALHRRGLKVIYYISPQLWAWRSYRVKSIQRDVDLLLTVLPFEKHWYAERGVTHVEFVGHPLAGEVHATYGRDEFCRRNELDLSRPIISLLPGSRRKELERILPPMLSAANIVQRTRADVQFVLAIAPSRSLEETKTILSNTESVAELRVVHNQTREALAASDAAAVASGTATLEAALLNTPMVVVYKESAINWHTLGRLINAEHYGLVNLIAGKRLVTELMQNGLTDEKLAAELIGLLSPETNAQLRNELKKVTHDLGEGGASDRAAASIIKFLK